MTIKISQRHILRRDKWLLSCLTWIPILLAMMIWGECSLRALPGICQSVWLIYNIPNFLESSFNLWMRRRVWLLTITTPVQAKQKMRRLKAISTLTRSSHLSSTKTFSSTANLNFCLLQQSVHFGSETDQLCCCASTRLFRRSG